MQASDMILISSDDHVIEPPDAFKRHMPRKFAARAPFVERLEGADYWNFDGRRYVLGGLNAVAGRPRDEYGIEPTAFTEMRPAAFDVKARVDDMNANGVLAAMCFPSVMGFGGGIGLSLPDQEYALAVVQAYNDWHVHDWAGGAPGRFIPLPVVPFWDVDASVAEVKRLAKMNVHAISFPTNPAFGTKVPSIHSAQWDPLWRVCAENAIVLCCHIGTGDGPPFTTEEMTAAAWMTTIPMATSSPAADWLFAPMWKKFPDLRIALSEAGIGWVPYLMERADFIYDHHGAWTNTSFGSERPSDVFRRHFILCFTDDKYGLKNRHDIGIDKITWECDYPHSDCTWPDSPELLWENGMKELPADEVAKITHLNAMREFNFDPFKMLKPEDCTVAALRKLAVHIDTGPTHGLGGSKPGGESPVTVGEMRAKVAKQKLGVAA